MKTKTSEQIASIIKKNWLKKSFKEIAPLVGLTPSAVRGRGRRMGLPPYPNSGGKNKIHQVPIHEQIEIDKRKVHLQEDKKQSEKKYKEILLRNEKLERELNASLALKDSIAPVHYTFKPSNSKSESVAVVLASDWHIEENVRPEEIDGFNEYTVAIAEKRAEQFFRTVVRLCEVEGTFSKIDTLVLALLGDFISGNIHLALLEICELAPVDAMIKAENILIGGIQYILDNTKLNLIIPCHVGNHSRITQKVHIATETGNSLETIMYHHLKNHFRDNKRVTFLISPAYLSYLTVFDYTICFQHGHAVQFGGGIGGLTIPLRKAVSQWQKKRKVNLYCLGHWHQFLDIGDAIVNGSMIGYNSYAQFIKAEPEKPKQAFFIINKRFNDKISVRPILFEE